jgi:hypothetical protein
VRAIAGMGICPICHCAKKLWHVPANSPLLRELNLKLIHDPPSLSPAPVLAHPPEPASSTLFLAPFPGGHIESADDTTATVCAGSSTTLSALMVEVVEDFDSDEEFFWTGNEDGQDFSGHPPVLHKSNALVSLYPSCSHIAVDVIDLCPSRQSDSRLE